MSGAVYGWPRVSPMGIIRQRKIRQRYIGSSNVFDNVRIESMNQMRCANCMELWPTAMMAEQYGLFYCPNDTELKPLDAQKIIVDDLARGASKQVQYLTRQRPIAASQDTPQGCVTGVANASGVAVTPRAPLQLIHGGAAVTLKLTGVNFSSTNDTITYSSGISDSVSPVYTTTLVTLSLVAAGGATPGDFYSFTYNGTTFRNYLRVR